MGNGNGTRDTSRISRRTFLSGIAAMGLAATIGSPATIRAATSELRIGGPGGQEADTRKYLIPAFEAAHNCKVLYDGSQSLPNLQKMQANRNSPIFDVVMMDDPILLIAEKDGLLEKITPRGVPNLTKLVPDAVLRDGMWVNYMWPAISIAHFTRAVPQVPSWSVLWDSKYKERVLIPHPTTTQGPVTIVMAAHLETGKPLKEAQYDLDAGFRKLATIKPNLLDTYTSSAKAATLLEQGEAWLAAGFFTTYTLPRAKQGAPIDLARPKEGSFAMPKSIAKVKKAKNPELADAWINACLAPAAQKVWMDVFYGAPTNRDVATDPSLLPADKLVALDWAFQAEKLNEITARFDREIAR